MQAKHSITGLILAGGAGRRMGGADKGLLPWGDSTLAVRATDYLRPQVGTLLISCNRNLEYYASLADGIVSDSRRDFQGPLAGLEAASARISTEFLVIVPCDAPKLPGDLVVRLLHGLQEQESDISYAHDGIRGQYLCAILRHHCLASLTTYLNNGHRAVRHWYQSQRATSVDFSAQANCFYNHNEANQQA